MNKRISLLRYLLYPVVWVGSFVMISTLLAVGVNIYLATLPVVAGAAVVVLLLERALPYDTDWLHSKQGDLNLDTVHYVVNYGIKVVAQLLILWLGQSLVVWTIFPTTWPLWGQILLALTIIDFFLFAIHALSHRYEWLWKLHAIHHSSERLYWLNGDKRHPIHQVLEGLPGITLCVSIGTPMPVVAGALAVLAVNMILQHANLDYRAGWLKHLFSVAELHRWHHRADYKDAQVNYGAWLVIWDKLFGTYYDAPSQAEQIGQIGIAEEPDFPRTYAGQLRYPFRPGTKQVNSLLLSIGLNFSFLSFQTPEDSLLGTRRAPDGNDISIYRKGEQYDAKLTHVSKPELRNQLGSIVIWGMRYDKKRNEWNGGQLKMPGMEHTAEAFIRLSNQQLTITGYHGLRWL
ncbi:sterol desaturase family protein, partial [uncultured Spirosoma sp.]